MNTPLALALALLTLGCSHRPDPAPRLDSQLRFRNAPVVTAVGDGPAIACPVPRSFDRAAYFYDAYLGQRTVRALDATPATRARNVNALDDVPDGSWFENRAGARDRTLAAADLQDAPGLAPVPPFRVRGAKVGGTMPGLRIEDARGRGYLLKFDKAGDPDGETGAGVVVQRLLWAAGYHTSHDEVLVFDRTQLVIDPRARMKELLKGDRPMTVADLDGMLAVVDRRPDGRYRSLVSRLLDGVPVGGYAQEGRRREDPNDVVPHQDRRELRAGQVFFAWLNHVDMKEDNVLDTWVEDPRTPGKGHLRHHLVDFGNSLGLYGWQTEGSAGFTQLYDLEDGARSLVSLGMWKRPWEGLPATNLRGVGRFESERFRPDRWRAQYPWAPFERFDRHDGFWAARILMRVTPAHIAAAVAEARYEDPRSAAYITRTLIERQRKLGRYHLAQTSALDAFTVSASGDRATMCFDDLLVTHFGAEPGLRAQTRTRVQAWDYAGAPLGFDVQLPGAAHACAVNVPIAPDHDGYTIVDLATARAGAPAQRVLVHVARIPGQRALRVIGVRRL